MHAEAAILEGERHELADVRKASTNWAGGSLGSSRALGCARTSRPPRIPASPGFWVIPTEIALVELSQRVPGLEESCRFPRRDELPFDSERMRFSTLHETPEGLILYTKGRSRPCCRFAPTCSDDTGIEPLTQEWRDRFLQAQGTMADDGLQGPGAGVSAGGRGLRPRRAGTRLDPHRPGRAG